MTQFLIASENSCVVKPTTTETFLPTTTLLPAELPKKEETKITEQTTLPQPTISTSQPTATLSADVLFDLVNNHRKNLGLTQFEHDTRVCSVAESRRDEMVNEILVTRTMHAGFYSKDLPYIATENLIYQHTETEALNWWLNSKVHRAAVEGNYKYACGVCNGQVCNMVFTNYDSKVAVQDTTRPPYNLAKINP